MLVGFASAGAVWRCGVEVLVVGTHNPAFCCFGVQLVVEFCCVFVEVLGLFRFTFGAVGLVLERVGLESGVVISGANFIGASTFSAAWAKGAMQAASASITAKRFMIQRGAG